MLNVKVYIICYISRGATNREDDIYLSTHQHGRKEVLFRSFYLLLEFFMHVFNKNQSPFLGISSIFGILVNFLEINPLMSVGNKR